jgi:porin
MLKIYHNQIIMGMMLLINPFFQLQLYADESPTLEQAAPWFSLQNNLDLPDWIQFSLQTQAEPMLNPSGGTKQTRNWMQQTVGSIAIGSGLKKATKVWSEIDHWRIDTSVNYYNGNPNLNAEIGAYIPLQQVAHESGFWLTQATLSRSSGDGLVGIKGGILSINPDFIYSPIYDYYIHSSLNNTLNLSINDMPVNPLAAIGGVVELKPGNNLSMRYGLFDLDSTRPIATALGVNQPSNIVGFGLVQLLQVSYSPQWLAPAKPGSQLPSGGLQLGGYSTNNGIDGSAINGSLNFSTGLTLGLDHRFWIGSNYSFNSINNTTPTFISAGFLSQGILASRPFDVLILGFGKSGFSPTSAPGQSYEGVIELGYQLQLNPTLNLQPTVQWILNPGGAGNTTGIFATTLQITLNL